MPTNRGQAPPSLSGRLLFLNGHLLMRMLKPAIKQALDDLDA